MHLSGNSSNCAYFCFEYAKNVRDALCLLWLQCHQAVVYCLLWRFFIAVHAITKAMAGSAGTECLCEGHTFFGVGFLPSPRRLMQTCSLYTLRLLACLLSLQEGSAPNERLMAVDAFSLKLFTLCSVVHCTFCAVVELYSGRSQ